MKARKKKPATAAKSRRKVAKRPAARKSQTAHRTVKRAGVIKHALRMKSMHNRYRFFFDYGNAELYRQQIETVRRSFEDIDKNVAKDAAASEA